LIVVTTAILAVGSKDVGVAGRGFVSLEVGQREGVLGLTQFAWSLETLQLLWFVLGWVEPFS